MRLCSNCDNSFEAGQEWLCPRCGHKPPEENGYLVFAPEIGKVGFEIVYFEQLVKAEEGNFWFEARNQILLWALARFLPENAHFLEIGCGTGYVMRGIQNAFPRWSLTGSDIFLEALPYAAKRAPQVTFMQIDARRIPYTAEFDGIGVFDVLEHIHEDTLVLEQMHKALKPGGYAVMSVPQHPSLWSPVDAYWEHFRRYTQAELRCKVEAAGLRVVYATSFVSLLLPAMLLSRRRLNRLGAAYDPYTEYKTGVVNATLKGMMTLERTLIRGGARFPAGGSLLMVAQRPV